MREPWPIPIDQTRMPAHIAVGRVGKSIYVVWVIHVGKLNIITYRALTIIDIANCGHQPS